jgi:dTDP-glucose 4,6-dehydratase
VEDHCRAIDLILQKGKPGEVYNVGGNCEKTNLELVEELCRIMDELKPNKLGLQSSGLSPALSPDSSHFTSYSSLITYVKDRAGHDRRYAIDAKKISSELGFLPKETFETGIGKTIQWYLENESWWRSVMDGSYQEWLKTNYA